MGLAIGVDVGGTKVAAGVVADDGTVVAEVRRPTPSASPEQTADVIVELVEELRKEHDVTAIGVGAAGFIDSARSTVMFSPNLAWRDEPLRERISDRIGLPVVIENDANAAGWAEAKFGAGRGEAHLVLVTLGTGIGGAIVLEGKLYRGRWGIAGEPGHMTMVQDGILCGCGNRGCWERYCSGTALTRAARERVTASPVAGHDLLEFAGGDVKGLTGPVVTEAAKAGEQLAVELLADVSRWLGLGLANISAVLDPGTYIIGGGLAAAGELLLAPARTSYAGALTGRGHRPLAEIRLAQLGNEAGVVGAADLARLES
ncbi:MAG: ROK family glucokinase [Actinomycetota bacterium]